MVATDPDALGVPTGTVTFLFSDIEGSTRLLHEHGDGYVEVLAQHRRILRAAFAAHQGVEIGTEGDSFFVAFARASDAVAAATAGQRGLDGGPVRVRMGLHAGEPLLTAGGYVGMVVHRAARIAAAAHGGQVLMSKAVAELVGDRLPVDAALRDLGSVRLKDLGAPEHVYQITHPQLRESFPALRSLESTPNNLPQQTTSFVGREREIAAIQTLLARTRLLTLTGSGGSGKTRLSLHVAADVLEEFRDGAWLVELAALVDPSLLPQTVATVLGVKEEPGKPVLDTLTAHLKARNVLLLLDNCEHLLDGCAKVAAALLRQCPEVTLVATSREALGIAGEQTYRLPSLSLPDQSHVPTLQSLSMYESVQLFIDRALLVRPEFTVTNRNAPALASLCHHLDGIPLAIELAAARVRSLSVEEIDRKLNQRSQLLTGGSRTASPRHQTLRALIDWSYDLLHEAEQLLLQRLSVFAGGWTLEAVEAVCAGERVDRVAILDLLTSLIDKNLVVADQSDGHSRYRLLKTIRQYAQDRLVEGRDGDEFQERHRDYFLALAEEVMPKLMGTEQTECLQRLDQEHENLRASLDYSLVVAGPGAGLRLCWALSSFWATRGHFSEGRAWCARALQKAPADERTAQRAKALNAAGRFAWLQADYRVAEALIEESLSICRQLGDMSGAAGSLTNLGNVLCDANDFASARALYEESLGIYRKLGDRHGIASSLNNLACVAFEFTRDFAAARALYAESLEIHRELGNRIGVAYSLCNLGTVSCELGDYSSAGALHREGLEISRELGDQAVVAETLHNLGHTAIEQGNYLAARVQLSEALAIWRGLGDRRGVAFSLEGLAVAITASERSTRAAIVWGAAARLREDIASPLPPSERERYEKRVGNARSELGDDVSFDCAWQEGRALTLEQAIKLALETPVDRSA